MTDDIEATDRDEYVVLRAPRDADEQLDDPTLELMKDVGHLSPEGARDLADDLDHYADRVDDKGER